MRSVMFVVVLLVVGIAGIGYYRGCSLFQQTARTNRPVLRSPWTKSKFHADEQKARTEVQGVWPGRQKENWRPVWQAKQPQPQP